MIKKSKILFSGELPPNSIHGVAYSNEINIRFLKEIFDVKIDEEYVDLTFHEKFNVRKFKNLISRLIRVFKFSLNNKFDFFYIVFSTSKAGAFKTILVILLFRILNFSSICVIHIHRGDLKVFIDKGRLNRVLFYLTKKLIHRIIVLSGSTKEYIESEFGNKSEVYILPNTINDEVVFNKKRKLKLINSKTDRKFIYISNYIEQKGILLLLEIFSQLGNDFKLKCYGNFSDLTLKEKILSFNSENIEINGPITGLKKYEAIYESDALILPSFNEGKPLVLLEAMYVGVPFIAPNVGYIKEMVFDHYPYIYDKNTSKDLLDMINYFSSIPIDEEIKLREAFKIYYFKNFSNKKHRSKLHQIFSE